MQKFIIVGVGVLVGVLIGWVAVMALGLDKKFMAFQITPSQGEAPSTAELQHEEVHNHVDLRIVLNGKQLDLSEDKYQSNSYEYLDEHIHLHDNNGAVVHLHEADVTLNEFLETIHMNVGTQTDCFTIASEFDDEPYCETEDSTNVLKVMVNGEEKAEKGEYVLQDLDKILIYFGPPNQAIIDQELKSITDDACLYSETCPERGKPPVENCVASADRPCVVPQR